MSHVADTPEAPTPHYACTECGHLVPSRRKPHRNRAFRCEMCTQRARLAQKRATWHRYKQRYRPTTRVA